MSPEPYRKCSRFQRCSVNNCPLSPGYPDHYTDSNDYEQKCTIAKSIRVRIGSQHLDVLKFGGLTRREFAGRKAWENLTDKQRAATTERGKKNIVALQSHRQNKKDTLEYGGVENE